MQHNALSAPTGFKGPRAAILLELKRAHRLTANDLARQLDASLNAVRHHLKELESDGLVVFDRERRGVGAPVFAYRLSERGEALFPRRYEGALLQLLDRMVEREGRTAAVEMLESHFDALATRLAPELRDVPFESRLQRVTQALAEEGFMAESVARGGGAAVVVAHNCALLAIAERFPEMCDAEQRCLAAMLGTPVERVSHILDGCGACGYRVRIPNDEPVSDTESR